MRIFIKVSRSLRIILQTQSPAGMEVVAAMRAESTEEVWHIRRMVLYHAERRPLTDAPVIHSIKLRGDELSNKYAE